MNDIGDWSNIEVQNSKTPGKRYGHSLSYLKPYIILFGGINDKGEELNDLWVINPEYELKYIKWEKISFSSDVPRARVYHSSVICNYNDLNEKILIFGGKSKKLNDVFNDLWELNLNKNKFEFKKIVTKSNVSP